MSYAALINSNLRNAFNTLVKDLAIVATFQRSDSHSFDFNTVTAKAKTTSVESKIIVVDETKVSSKSNSKMKQIMVRSKDIGDLKAFDRVVVNGEEWVIGQVINNSGYIYLLEINKEA